MPDCLPSWFVARTNAEDPPLYALFENRLEVLPQEDFLTISVICSVPPGWQLGIAETYCQSKIFMESIVRTAATSRQTTTYITEGIQVPVFFAPNPNLLGAQLITLPPHLLPPSQANVELQFHEAIFERRYQEPRMEIWSFPEPPPSFTPTRPPLVNTTPRQPPPQQPPALPFPPHVRRILIDTEIQAGSSCPISFAAITKENAALTSCGHVFDKDSIQEWLSKSPICPVCRTQTLLLL